MAQVENFQKSAQYCFDLATASGLSEEDIAIEAFELLTANDHDSMLAHALGVSL